VIAHLEDDDYRARVEEAEADLGARRSALRGIEAERDAALLAVAQSEARAAATKARAVFAGEEAARQKRILASDLGLLRAAQRAVADQKAIAATGGADQASTSQASAQVSELDARLALARADIETAAARLDLARIDLGHTIIRAPTDGTLGTRQVHVGDLVSTGRTVVDLTPLADVWVQAFFKETQMTNVRIGQSVAARFDAFPGVQIIGRVDQVGPITLQ
jgi:membrane fusion protein (multidrug efflux system)